MSSLELLDVDDIGALGHREMHGLALCALGAGSGNSPTEVLAAVFDRLGIDNGLDVSAMLDAAEDVVRPYLPRWPPSCRASGGAVQGACARDPQTLW
ncbi:hypothetical protein GCM10023175_46840 [Pseudonocardia xishanensis]|uniref:Uncharacterized protein n=1 Tax=Pseudonocardia xishanensis TaxID=630995 RepID=A0ABP8RY46_9PSEU